MLLYRPSQGANKRRSLTGSSHLPRPAAIRLRAIAPASPPTGCQGSASAGAPQPIADLTTESPARDSAARRPAPQEGPPQAAAETQPAAQISQSTERRRVSTAQAAAAGAAQDIRSGALQADDDNPGAANSWRSLISGLSFPQVEPAAAAQVSASALPMSQPASRQEPPRSLPPSATPVKPPHMSHTGAPHDARSPNQAAPTVSLQPASAAQPVGQQAADTSRAVPARPLPEGQDRLQAALTQSRAAKRPRAEQQRGGSLWDAANQVMQKMARRFAPAPAAVESPTVSAHPPAALCLALDAHMQQPP
jgi:hypothetical protein